jgi:SWI/SNF-related matrix-associated actin-dependent regulator of chromatin subfamily A member 5
VILERVQGVVYMTVEGSLKGDAAAPVADAEPAASPRNEPEAAPGPPSPDTSRRLNHELAKQNAEVARDTQWSTRQRLKYLVLRYDIFAHFLSSGSLAKQKLVEAAGSVETASPGEGAAGGTPGRRRLTEREEDALLLEADEEGHSESVHLTVQPPGIRGTMRPYQIEGLNWLVRLHQHGINGILADEMGLGKTLQTIALLAFLKVYKGIRGPHLVIAPKSTLGNWNLEFEKFCPDFRVVRFHGDQEERARVAASQLIVNRFDVCVTSYEIAILEKAVLRKFHWRYLIIDEAHRIKNENSVLSQVVRMYNSQNRLLITGTPLQNNLHELWALLNFLLPDVFSSSEDFDAWFEQVEGTTEEDAKAEMVRQLHAVLRPFLLRRLKSEVARELPPKKERIVFVRLTKMQHELYRSLLKKDVDAISGQGGDRARLLNILMQLRKCCNHPYLFEGVEDRTLDPFGEHVVQNSAKLALLDKLLPRLRAEGHRVLIFSQMTRMLDILEDYCCEQMRGYPYCRIDGSTDSETRERMIEEFNAEGSDKFIFLLSTRAGGLGINLASADTVILYDSDWNPQVDLQAMDRAHRIGQKRPVTVLRLICESTVEERILRRALMKLKIDNMVIQQGRLVEGQKALARGEVLDMIRFGADSFFRADAQDFKDEDLDEILQRAEAKTKEVTESMEEEARKRSQHGLNLMDFKMSDDVGSVYQFEGKDWSAEAASSAKNFFFLDVGKRERRNTIKSYDEAAYFREALYHGGASGDVGSTQPQPKQRMRLPPEPKVYDWQFFNVDRIMELYEKERQIIDEYNRTCENLTEDQMPPEPEPLSPSERAELERLLQEGFSNWRYREFQQFLRACERHGRHNIEAIAADLAQVKTFDEVKEYAEAFWRLGPDHIRDWPRLLEQIEQGEARVAKREEMERALRNKIARYADPWNELELPASVQGKVFSDEEDRFLLIMVNNLGYGRWEELKMEIRRSWRFRFDWLIKSRSAVELKRRVDVLLRAIERENAELEKAEAAAANRKKHAQVRSVRRVKSEASSSEKESAHNDSRTTKRAAAGKASEQKPTANAKRKASSSTVTTLDSTSKRSKRPNTDSVTATSEKRSTGPIERYARRKGTTKAA